MNLQKLLINMTDQVKEAQLKLGYAKETVRLYYPLSSLCAILEISPDPAAADSDQEKSREVRFFGTKLAEELSEAFAGDCVLGKLSFACHGSRMEVSIPPEGVEYVHLSVKEPEFLKAVIALFRENHHCRVEELCRLFERFDRDYVCERLEEEAARNMGFDYVLFFRNPSVDAYYYCIKEEMGHTIYHRFAKEDYMLLRKEAGLP